jgi:hypothetical protein
MEKILCTKNPQILDRLRSTLNLRAENLNKTYAWINFYAHRKTSKDSMIVHRSKPSKSAYALILSLSWYHAPMKYFTPTYPTAGIAPIPTRTGSPSRAPPPIAALWQAAYHDPAVTPVLPILAIMAAAVEPAAGPAAVNPMVFNTTGMAAFTASPVPVKMPAAVPAVSAIFSVFLL